MGEKNEYPQQADAIVVGGGVAGLATAWQLAEMGSKVVLLEAEELLASHSSARNAAIFLPLEESTSAIWLANRSRDLIDSRIGTGWIDATGIALLSAHEEALDELRFLARQWGVFHERWGRGAIEARMPHLSETAASDGVHLPLGGVMDIELLLSRLQSWSRAAGAQLFTRAKVAEIRHADDAVQGVVLEDGEEIQSSNVVLAAGAWAGALGRQAGCELDLTPMRRHLVHLTGEGLTDLQRGPVAWRIDDPIYYRPEGDGILASPCDETPSHACVPTTDEAQLDLLARKLQQLAPSFAELGVHRSWACLRTFAQDREIVAGPDPRMKGLFWIGGLGGRGMTCGTAAGEATARSVRGLGHPLAAQLGPSRLL